MMVLRTGGVECPAKIAMAVLFSGHPATRLLLDHGTLREDFSSRSVTAICSR
jgi:hypothetical protein